MLKIIIGILFTSLMVFAANDAEIKPMSFKDSKGKLVGEAKLDEEAGGVKISLDLKGLKPGTYAMHIHEVGKCDAPKFDSAGPHFNPTHKQHGVHNPKGFHAGDLPNLTIPAGGNLKQKVSVKNVNLKAGTTNTLMTPEGTSLVIHAKPDDDKTDPSGNSGDRLYCAVLMGPQVAK